MIIRGFDPLRIAYLRTNRATAANTRFSCGRHLVVNQLTMFSSRLGTIGKVLKITLSMCPSRRVMSVISTCVVGNKSVPCWPKRRAVFGKAACRVIKRGMPCPETCHFACPNTAFRVCYLPAAFYFVPKVECGFVAISLRIKPQVQAMWPSTSGSLFGRICNPTALSIGIYNPAISFHVGIINAYIHCKSASTRGRRQINGLLHGIYMLGRKHELPYNSPCIGQVLIKLAGRGAGCQCPFSARNLMRTSFISSSVYSSSSSANSSRASSTLLSSASRK